MLEIHATGGLPLFAEEWSGCVGEMRMTVRQNSWQREDLHISQITLPTMWSHWSTAWVMMDPQKAPTFPEGKPPKSDHTLEKEWKYIIFIGLKTILPGFLCNPIYYRRNHCPNSLGYKLLVLKILYYRLMMTLPPITENVNIGLNKCPLWACNCCFLLFCEWNQFLE